MTNDTCTPRGLYPADSCYDPSYSIHLQSELPYGPDNQYSFSPYLY